MKKKLIAIVTSLAMVATMVPATAAAATQPGTAGTKTVAQAKSLSTFADALGKLPEPSTVTKANVDNNLSLYNTVYTIYQDLNATELSDVTDAQKQQMNAFKDALVAVYAGLMGEEIKATASARKVEVSTTFTKIENYEKKLAANPLNLKTAEIKEAVGTNTYAWYEEAQKARTVAELIEAKATDLKSTNASTKKAAVEALEEATGFKGVSEGTKAMAANYNIYRDAKDYLALVESADKLVKGYTDRFLAQEKVVRANTVTASDVNNAEALLDEADGSIALKRAIKEGGTATTAVVNAYKDAHKYLYIVVNGGTDRDTTTIAGAKTEIADQEKANEFAALVDQVKVTDLTDVNALLNGLAKIQQIYVMAKNGTLTGKNETQVAAINTADELWYKKTTATTRDKAKKAIKALQDYIAFDSATAASGSPLPGSIAAITVPADKTAAITALNKAIFNQFKGIIPSGKTVGDRDMYAIANEVLKAATATPVYPTLVGLNLGVATASGDVADATIILDGVDGITDVRTKTLPNALKEIEATEDTAKEKAAKFVTEVLKATTGDIHLNAIDTTAANYEARLRDAQKLYDALDPAYKKGGALYETGIVADLDGDSSTESVKKAYENAGAGDGTSAAEKDMDTNYIPYDIPAVGSAADGAFSLRTLQLNYQMEKEGLLQDKLFKELVDGIDALPEASKLTINDKDAVYALQTKRDSMTEEAQDQFGTEQEKYNSKLNDAIDAIDALVAESVNAQIVALTKVKPTATQEEIAAAKAANKAARDAYEALTASQKKAVTTYGFLEDAEAAVAAAEVQYAKDQMTAALEGVDTANLTEDQAKAILAANSVINALPGTQKAEVEKAENYAAFQEAVKAASDKLGVKDPTDPIGPTGPSDLEDVAKVAKIAAQTYNGKAKTPAVTVKAGNKTLVKGTDYDVTYAKDHTSIGEVKVTITGKENYKGTITTSFIIKPGVVTLSKKPVAGKKQITVSYKTQKAQNSKKVGYRIICKTKGIKATAVNTTAAGKKTIKGLKSGKTYQVKVRAYKTIGGATYYGGYSKVQKVKVK